MKDSYFLNGCAILQVVPWPSASNALVQDYIDIFWAHIHHYQESADVYLIYDWNISRSIKEGTQNERNKGVTEIFRVIPTSQLPAAKVIFTLTSNAVQIVNCIIKGLTDHKDQEVTHSLILTGPESVSFELSSGTGI